MENILKIIYRASLNNRHLGVKELEDILQLLINIKQYENYILNLDVIFKNNKLLASYCVNSKTITINYGAIRNMFVSIDKNLVMPTSLEQSIYKNLLILQIILHELEHVNQENFINIENALESLILEISSRVPNNPYLELYEISTEERLAEIKSFDAIINMIKPFQYRFETIYDVLQIDKLQRLLRGYHYNGHDIISSPFINYMIKSNNSELLNLLDWYCNDEEKCLQNVIEKYGLRDRVYLGFPITMNEYVYNMKNLILSSGDRYVIKY